jgi:hypothetical protein
MPCMNSTSAGDRGGRMARVDDESILLGAPGAPGCTTTGCWARAEAAKRETAKMPAASHARRTAPRVLRGSGLRRKQTCLQWSVRGKIFIWTGAKYCHKQNGFRDLLPRFEGRDYCKLTTRFSGAEVPAEVRQTADAASHSRLMPTRENSKAATGRRPPGLPAGRVKVSLASPCSSMQ